MKKIKNLLFMGVMIFVFMFSSNVLALTEQERYEKLDILPFEIIGEQKILSVDVIDPDIMLEDGRCLPDESEYERIIDENPEFGFTLEEWETEMLNICKSEFYSNVLKLYFKAQEWDNGYYAYFSDENPNKNEARIVFNDGDEENGYDVIINYSEDINEQQFNTATDILDNMDNKYSIFGMNLINSIYHFGVSEGNSAYSDNKIIKRYSQIKEISELNPTYDFATHLISGMGTPYFSIYGGQIAIIKDDVLYNIKNISFYEHTIVYVDEDATGTVFEKAENRLKEYFNNTVDVEVDGTNSWDLDGSQLDETVNEDLGNDGVGYTGYFADINLDGVETYIVIVEIPSEELDQYKVKSVDSTTGISIETSSYDVSLDASIIVNDVTIQEYVRQAKERENLDILKAYDLSLTKLSDGTFIRTIESGIEVYIPVDDTYQENETVEIYYITDEGTLGETINGVVVAIDGRLYVKFSTNHFSTYAVERRGIANPSTSDGINNYIGLGIITMFCLFAIILYTKKEKFN